MPLGIGVGGWVGEWVEKMNECYDVIMMSLQKRKKENRVIEIWYIMGRKIEFKMQIFMVLMTCLFGCICF